MDALWKPVARGLSGSAICAVLLVPANATADPIVLTGGAVDVLPGGAVHIRLLGPEFSFGGGAHISGGVFAPESCVVPECGPGTIVDLAGLWLGNDLGGIATYRGATYAGVGGLDASAQMLVELAGSFAVPSGGGVIKAPFSLTGQLSYPVGPDDELRAVLLAGRGTATIWLSELDDAPGFFRASRVRYTVEPPIPTPEPGSLGLLLAGLAWGASKGRRYLER